MPHTELNALAWLSAWYRSRCNEEWEHSYGITIDTLDNPGWTIRIDLAETPLEDLDLLFDANPGMAAEGEWYVYQIKDGIFDGSGDPDKLETLILAFKEIWESNAGISGA